MAMEKLHARRLWAQLCCESVGAAQDEEITRITTLGSVATAANLDLYIASHQEGAEKVAAWLEEWAKAIRGQSPDADKRGNPHAG